jgi:putative permease
MKHLTLTITTTMATLATILVVWQLRSIVLLFLFSIIFAAAFRRPIERLIQRGYRRWLAMLLVYGLGIVGFIALVGFLIFPWAREIGALTEDLAQLYERGYGLVQGGAAANNALFRRLPSVEVVGQLLLESQPTALVRHLLGFTQGFAAFIGQALLAIVLSVYWAADQLRFERLWLSLLAPGQRARMRELWYMLEDNIGAYIRSEVLQSVIAGGLLTLGFWLMGLDYPFLLATIGAIAWFIPLIGALFAILLIAALALLNGPVLALAAALYAIIIFVVLEFVVEPRVYDRSRYGAILVILMMMAMVDVLGIVGLLLAPPLALTIQIIWDELLKTPTAPLPVAPELATVITFHDLEDQLAKVRAAISSTETQSPRAKNMVERLEQLVKETREATG